MDGDMVDGPGGFDVVEDEVELVMSHGEEGFVMDGEDGGVGFGVADGSGEGGIGSGECIEWRSWDGGEWVGVDLNITGHGDGTERCGIQPPWTGGKSEMTSLVWSGDEGCLYSFPIAMRQELEWGWRPGNFWQT